MQGTMSENVRSIRVCTMSSCDKWGIQASATTVMFALDASQVVVERGYGKDWRIKFVEPWPTIPCQSWV